MKHRWTLLPVFSIIALFHNAAGAVYRRGLENDDQPQRKPSLSCVLFFNDGLCSFKCRLFGQGAEGHCEDKSCVCKHDGETYIEGENGFELQPKSKDLVSSRSMSNSGISSYKPSDSRSPSVEFTAEENQLRLKLMTFLVFQSKQGQDVDICKFLRDNKIDLEDLKRLNEKEKLRNKQLHSRSLSNSESENIADMVLKKIPNGCPRTRSPKTETRHQPIKKKTDSGIDDLAALQARLDSIPTRRSSPFSHSPKSSPNNQNNSSRSSPNDANEGKSSISRKSLPWYPGERRRYGSSSRTPSSEPDHHQNENSRSDDDDDEDSPVSSTRRGCATPDAHNPKAYPSQRHGGSSPSNSVRGGNMTPKAHSNPTKRKFSLNANSLSPQSIRVNPPLYKKPNIPNSKPTPKKKIVDKPGRFSFMSPIRPDNVLKMNSKTPRGQQTNVGSMPPYMIQPAEVEILPQKSRGKPFTVSSPVVHPTRRLRVPPTPRKNMRKPPPPPPPPMPAMPPMPPMPAMKSGFKPITLSAPLLVPSKITPGKKTDAHSEPSDSSSEKPVGSDTEAPMVPSKPEETAIIEPGVSDSDGDNEPPTALDDKQHGNAENKETNSAHPIENTLEKVTPTAEPTVEETHTDDGHLPSHEDDPESSPPGATEPQLSNSDLGTVVGPSEPEKEPVAEEIHTDNGHLPSHEDASEPSPPVADLPQLTDSDPGTVVGPSEPKEEPVVDETPAGDGHLPSHEDTPESSPAEASDPQPSNSGLGTVTRPLNPEEENVQTPEIESSSQDAHANETPEGPSGSQNPHGIEEEETLPASKLDGNEAPNEASVDGKNDSVAPSQTGRLDGTNADPSEELNPSSQENLGSEAAEPYALTGNISEPELGAEKKRGSETQDDVKPTNDSNELVDQTGGTKDAEPKPDSAPESPLETEMQDGEGAEAKPVSEKEANDDLKSEISSPEPEAPNETQSEQTPEKPNTAEDPREAQQENPSKTIGESPEGSLENEQMQQNASGSPEYAAHPQTNNSEHLEAPPETAEDSEPSNGSDSHGSVNDEPISTETGSSKEADPETEAKRESNSSPDEPNVAPETLLPEVEGNTGSDTTPDTSSKSIGRNNEPKSEAGVANNADAGNSEPAIGATPEEASSTETPENAHKPEDFSTKLPDEALQSPAMPEEATSSTKEVEDSPLDAPDKADPVTEQNSLTEPVIESKPEMKNISDDPPLTPEMKPAEAAPSETDVLNEALVREDSELSGQTEALQPEPTHNPTEEEQVLGEFEDDDHQLEGTPSLPLETNQPESASAEEPKHLGSQDLGPLEQMPESSKTPEESHGSGNEPITPSIQNATPDKPETPAESEGGKAEPKPETEFEPVTEELPNSANAVSESYLDPPKNLDTQNPDPLEQEPKISETLRDAPEKGNERTHPGIRDSTPNEPDSSESEKSESEPKLDGESKPATEELPNYPSSAPESQPGVNEGIMEDSNNRPESKEEAKPVENVDDSKLEPEEGETVLQEYDDDDPYPDEASTSPTTLTDAVKQPKTSNGNEQSQPSSEDPKKPDGSNDSANTPDVENTAQENSPMQEPNDVSNASPTPQNATDQEPQEPAEENSGVESNNKAPETSPSQSDSKPESQSDETSKAAEPEPEEGEQIMSEYEDDDPYPEESPNTAHSSSPQDSTPNDGVVSSEIPMKTSEDSHKQEDIESNSPKEGKDRKEPQNSTADQQASPQNPEENPQGTDNNEPEANAPPASTATSENDQKQEGESKTTDLDPKTDQEADDLPRNETPNMNDDQDSSDKNDDQAQNAPESTIESENPSPETQIPAPEDEGEHVMEEFEDDEEPDHGITSKSLPISPGPSHENDEGLSTPANDAHQDVDMLGKPNTVENSTTPNQSTDLKPELDSSSPSESIESTPVADAPLDSTPLNKNSNDDETTPHTSNLSPDSKMKSEEKNGEDEHPPEEKAATDSEDDKENSKTPEEKKTEANDEDDKEHVLEEYEDDDSLIGDDHPAEHPLSSSPEAGKNKGTTPADTITPTVNPHDDGTTSDKTEEPEKHIDADIPDLDGNEKVLEEFTDDDHPDVCDEHDLSPDSDDVKVIKDYIIDELATEHEDDET